LSSIPLKTIVTKIAATVATSAALSVAIAVDAPKAEAGSFDWFLESGMFSVEGMFTTDIASGLITEEDVSSHTYTVFDSGNPLYKVDLVGQTLMAFDGGSETVIEAFHDFEYLIGSNQFSPSTDPDDPLFPIDFTFQTVEGDVEDPDAPIFTGLSFDSRTDTWLLERDGEPLATTDGLESGPVVEAVPEPASILGLLAIGAMGATSALKKKQTQ
jgi:hypothetical protein